MLSRRHQRFTMLTAAAALLFACGETEDLKKDPAEEADDPTGINAPGQPADSGLSAVDDVTDLGLSKLSVKLPDALNGKTSASLALTAQKRSREACMMGQTVKEVMQRLDTIANMACHIGVEAAKIKFGVNYKIALANGQEFGRINVTKDAGKITMGFCGGGSGGEGESNRELITLTKVTANGPVGTIHNDGTYDSNSYSSFLNFDLSTLGLQVIDAKQLHKSGQNEFRRFVSLSLSKDGVSEVALAESGIWENSDFSRRGYGKIDQALGNTLFQSAGKHNGQTYSFTNRSYFDTQGFVALASDAKFASGGVLNIKASDVPNYLSKSDVPDAVTGWVGTSCATVDETVTLDPNSAAHQACETPRDETQIDCWGQDFEQGEGSQDL